MIKQEIGNTYGRLNVVAYNGSLSGKASWLCNCTCGSVKIATGDSLRTGKVSSCGCYQKECRGKAQSTHKLSKSSTYRSWQEMKIRCDSPDSISYKNYGSRGITYAKRWVNFSNFLEDMGIKPAGSSLDRIDNEGSYSPENCRWATRIEQNRNKRSNVLVRYRGKTKCLSEWCEHLKAPYPRLYYRIVVKKWDSRKAFETPFITHKERFRKNCHD